MGGTLLQKFPCERHLALENSGCAGYILGRQRFQDDLLTSFLYIEPCALFDAEAPADAGGNCNLALASHTVAMDMRRPPFMLPVPLRQL